MDNICLVCGAHIDDTTELEHRCSSEKLTENRKYRNTYPNTNKRRRYMKLYMRKRRRQGKA